jgi:hypothetical protein
MARYPALSSVHDSPRMGHKTIPNNFIRIEATQNMLPNYSGINVQSITEKKKTTGKSTNTWPLNDTPLNESKRNIKEKLKIHTGTGVSSVTECLPRCPRPKV